MQASKWVNINQCSSLHQLWVWRMQTNKMFLQRDARWTFCISPITLSRSRSFTDSVRSRHSSIAHSKLINWRIRNATLGRNARPVCAQFSFVDAIGCLSFRPRTSRRIRLKPRSGRPTTQLNKTVLLSRVASRRAMWSRLKRIQTPDSTRRVDVGFHRDTRRHQRRY